MAIWNGLTDTGAIVPIQVDDQGRVVVSGGGGIPSQVYGTAKAAATVTENGDTEWAINLSVTAGDSGVYVCTFDGAMADTNYAPFVQVAADQSRVTVVEDKTTTGFRVKLRGTSGTAQKAAFNVVVFDNKPTDVTPLILPVAALNDIERLKDAVGLDDDSPIS